MKIKTIILLLLAAVTVFAAAPVVNNVRFAQRDDGSLLVDIYYDVTDADGDILEVGITASNDDGATWILPCTRFGGDVGKGIVPGINKHIVWDFFTDNPWVSGNSYRVRVTANEMNSTGNTPPTASFTVEPTFGTTQTVFNFDATGCSDLEDPTSALQVRWDWEDNGAWDTDYTTIKTATNQFPISTGVKTIRLEVMDSGGLRDATTRQVTITLKTGTMTDIDGNVYQTVKIGNQWWMAQDLKVTHYRNGDPIPNVTDNTQWVNLTTGAYCYYDNNRSYADTYSALYNCYAVNDSRNIAPAGWHVPTDTEWQTLINFLGGDAVACGKMKETGTEHWNSPNTGATNESGFTARPGGYRSYSNGSFYDMIYTAYYWSATEFNTNYAWVRLLYYNLDDVSHGYGSKHAGFSVRLVRD
ncbi:MAG TPA: fibrobacter succinogenes major paralogous domain-containing protein [bacterium]|nr:fibrobacter succinogenes major paralogous domain-containing protein [bacterium]